MWTTADNCLTVEDSREGKTEARCDAFLFVDEGIFEGLFEELVDDGNTNLVSTDTDFIVWIFFGTLVDVGITIDDAVVLARTETDEDI